jgi:porphyrinogen peroxidase
MLTNMFIGSPPGNTDRILDFSVALTGCLFFAPSADFLDDPPDAPGAAGESAGVQAQSAVMAQDAAGDGSLGIGSLKGKEG